MPRKAVPEFTDYARVNLTHHALSHERSEMLRRRPGRPLRRPECLSIGHAWAQDDGREGGSICLVCHVVRWP